jgi:hypothetical protein
MALRFDAASGLMAWSADAVEVRSVAARSPPAMELSCTPQLPPEPPPWTRSSCVLVGLSLTGGTGPARTHRAPTRCARVGLGLPQGRAAQDDTSGRCPWSDGGHQKVAWH